MKTTFTILMLLLLSAGSALGQEENGEDWTADGESGGALPEMVVEAENEVRQDIDKGTFEFELDAAAVDSFFTAMDEEVLGVSPVSGESIFIPSHKGLSFRPAKKLQSAVEDSRSED